MSSSNIARQLVGSDSIYDPEESLRDKRARPKMAGFSSWAGKRASRYGILALPAKTFPSLLDMTLNWFSKNEK